MHRDSQLLIYHRNRLFRECLRSALANLGDYEVTEVSHEADDYLDIIVDSQPLLVLIDLSLPRSRAIEIAQFTREKVPHARVIVLVAPQSENLVVDGIAAGAHGCVLEEASMQELQQAISRVLDGESFCSPRIVEAMFNQLARLGSETTWRENSAGVDLTPRELEILELVSQGNTNKKIAEMLSVSIYTVKNHVHNILEKLDVQNRNQAVEHARQRQWFSRA